MLTDASSVQHRPLLLPPMQMPPSTSARSDPYGLKIVPVCQPPSLPLTTTTNSSHLWSQAYHFYSKPSFSMSFPSSTHFKPISSTAPSFSGSVSNHSVTYSMPPPSGPNQPNQYPSTSPRFPNPPPGFQPINPPHQGFYQHPSSYQQQYPYWHQRPLEFVEPQAKALPSSHQIPPLRGPHPPLLTNNHPKCQLTMC